MSWQSAKLGEVCDVRDGTHDSPKYTETGFPLITSKNLVSGYIDMSNASYISEADYINICKRSKVDYGDILMPMIGTIGNPVVVDEPSPEFAIKNVALIKFTDTSPDRSFIKSVLQSKLFATYVDNASRGGTQKFLSLGDIRKFSIPLPPLPEQRRIAAILDKADELKRKREAAIAKLDQLAQSIFEEMFGDASTNPRQWPTLNLGELIRTGPQNGLYKPSKDYGSGTPILRIDAFYDGLVTKLDSLKRLRLTEAEIALFGLAEGDIVINRVNSLEYLGKSALIPELKEPTVFESNMMRFNIDPNRLNPVYLVNYLQTKFIKNQILSYAKNAVNQSSINQQDVKALLVNLPPLSLQNSFLKRLLAIEKIKSENKQALIKQNNLFASLQHQAFAGQL